MAKVSRIAEPEPVELRMLTSGLFFFFQAEDGIRDLTVTETCALPILFERNAGAAELTDAGSSLLRHANAILVHLDEATKELKSPKNWTKSDPLKVAGSYAASALL